MEGVKYNNTAGRILAIIEQTLLANADWRTEFVYLAAMGYGEGATENKALSPEQYAMLFKGLALMQGGLDEVEQQVRAHRSQNYNLYLKHFPQLRKALRRRVGKAMGRVAP